MNAQPYLFALFIGMLAQASLADDEIVLNANQMQSLGIVTAPIPAGNKGELAGMPAQVVIPGNQMFIVSTPLPAMLEQTLAGVGDSVSKGQVIAYLQSPQLAETQRGLLQASTQAQLAQDNLTRDEGLWKDGIISESRYRATKSQLTEAQAQLAERKQALRLSGMSDSAIAQLQTGSNISSQLAITSPITGVILEKSASAGQRLDAAVPLFKVAKLDPLALEIQAPLASTQGIKIGSTISVPAYQARGRLTAIGRSLTGNNQTILLRAIIQEGAANLRPGQFVEVSIATEAGNGKQWNTPNSALTRLGNKVLIFVQTPAGFRAETVIVLHEGEQNSLIRGNLKGDEKIAVRGVSALKASLMGIGSNE